jgi:tRNA acetyltransferase TAN1
MGYMGLVFVEAPTQNIDELAKHIREKVPEAEKVFKVNVQCGSKLEELRECVKPLASGISSDESFAVRTVRRGRHEYTSLEVNAYIGSIVKEATGARVDLENPDKVVLIQILQDRAYVSLVPGSEFYRKMAPSKFPMYKLYRRMVVAHEPYLGPPEASYVMGTRIGREIQCFEVGKLVVAPIGAVEGEALERFLKGVIDGQKSRLGIQKKSYGREVHRTEILVQDMYQFVRSWYGKPLIIFEPEGEPASKVGGELADFIIEKVFREKKVLGVMVGAREGVPSGLFRYADFVLDVAPGVVISTDLALTSGLIALGTAVHDKLLGLNLSDGMETGV